MKIKKDICFLIGLLLFSIQSFAVDISGFGSIGVSQTNRSDAILLDYSEHWSVGSDTVFGIQLNQRLNDKLSLTGQVMSQDNAYSSGDRFEPSVAWLFLSYQQASGARLRIGRLRAPLFMFSDTFDVSYAHHWVRPPLDVYTPLFDVIESFSGLDVSHITHFNDYEVEWLVLLGRSRGEFATFNLIGKPMLGVNFQVRWDDTLLRYGVLAVRSDQYSLTYDQLGDSFIAFAGIDPVFQEISNSFQLNDAWQQYHALGAQRQFNSWTVTTEMNLTVPARKDFSMERFGWYFSVSKQIGDWTPYGVVGYAKSEFDDDIQTLVNYSKAAVPEGVNASLDQLRQFTVLAFENFNRSGYSWTIGSRYELFEQAAIKFEFQYFDSSNAVIETPVTDTRKDLAIGSIILDFVF